jgi:tRNA(Arg) A34 adenosine deaminase TadA
MTERHQEWMAEAIRLSEESVRTGGGPFGAVIVRDGAILARGANQVTTVNDPTAHAEVVAIRSACATLATFELRGCAIYTSCEPCPMCLGAIYWARLEAVYFAATRMDAAAGGFDDEFIYHELRLPPGQRVLPTHSLMREEALYAFREWREKSDRINY